MATEVRSKRAIEERNVLVRVLSDEVAMKRFKRYISQRGGYYNAIYHMTYSLGFKDQVLTDVMPPVIDETKSFSTRALKERKVLVWMLMSNENEEVNLLFLLFVTKHSKEPMCQ